MITHKKPNSPVEPTGCHIVQITSAKGAEPQAAACPGLPESALADVKAAAANRRTDRYVAKDLQATSTRYELPGLAVIWHSKSKPMFDIPPPLDVPFEPTQLDETNPNMVALCGASRFTANDNASHSPGPLWKRWSVRLIGIRFLALIYVIQIIYHAYSQILGWLVFLEIASILVVLFLITSPSWARKWFIIPGGLVVRKFAIFKATPPLLRFSPADAVLILKAAQIRRRLGSPNLAR